MTIITTGTTLATTQAPPPEIGAPTTSNALSSDFETFLKMLTAQMKNQDPLNPIESTDYAVQLATFSSVEQQVLTNDLLKDLVGAPDSVSLESAAGWVGKKVGAQAPLYFDGDSVMFRAEPSPEADRALAIIRNSAGSIVAQFDIGAQTANHQWDGRDATGTLLSSGSYDISIESYKDDGLLSSDTALTFNEVIEVQRISDGLLLGLKGGGSLSGQEVVSIR